MSRQMSECGLLNARNWPACGQNLASYRPVFIDGTSKNSEIFGVSAQNDDYSFFESQRNALVEKHRNQYVVIKNKAILGFFETQLEAIQSTVTAHALGTFIVQKCVPKDEDVVRFHSRVSFA